MKKYHGIQALRFVAASLVVAEHLIGNVVQHWPGAASYRIPPLGFIGVIVFFGISGFIMVTSQYNSFGKGGQSLRFFWHRILRILPLYAIATTLQFINKRNFSDDYTIVNYVKSLLFIPYVGDGNLYRPVLGQGWTLNLEMFFYLVFALSLLLPRLGGFLLSIAVFIGIAFAQTHASELNTVMAFYANSIMLFFVCGMLIALQVKRAVVRTEAVVVPAVTWMLMLGAGVWINLNLRGSEQLAYNLIMVCACLWTAASYQPVQLSAGTRLAERLGDASYSTYLFHGFLLGALKILSNRVAEGQTFRLAVLVMVAIILANMIGFTLYAYVEQPIARWIKRMMSSPSWAKVV